MADNNPNRTNNTHEGKRKTSNALIIGGVLIAVIVLVYFLFGMGDNTDYPAPETTGTAEAPESTTGGTTAGTGTMGGGTAGDPALGTEGGIGEPSLDTGGANESAVGTEGITDTAPATDAEAIAN